MLLSELDEEVQVKAKQVNRELDFGPKKPGGPDKWSLDAKDSDDNGKLEDDDTQMSKIPRRSLRGRASSIHIFPIFWENSYFFPIFFEYL